VGVGVGVGADASLSESEGVQKSWVRAKQEQERRMSDNGKFDVVGKSRVDAAATADGLGANAAFTLSDVYSGIIPTPPHAHEDQHAQVNYYEFLQTPLASSLGYDNRGPADTNQLVVRPAGDSFPHAIPHFRHVTLTLTLTSWWCTQVYELVEFQV
jgi:hypothetical protein